MPFVVLLLRIVLISAWLILLGRVLLSWVDPRFERPISRFVYDLTEPVLAPVRRMLPRTGMLDLSPLVLLLGLALLMRVVMV
jgi:YggT family protein